ncbi:MAG: ATP-binding protein [Defluviitaleaceae bacterium]|nr:ATP-binding protein [Defluviitaleaceae bacterium]
MILGTTKTIDLSTSSFERIVTDGSLYVDKTHMIEHFLRDSSAVHLITRHRRLGKTLNMDTLRCFLTDAADYRHLFKGLYIESSPVWEKANSAPVFYFDFKGLEPQRYKKHIFFQIAEYIVSYCDKENLPMAVADYLHNKDFDNPNGLLYLTESVYKATGKRSYILIDEYDKLLMDSYKSDKYEEIRDFETLFFSAGVKGNHYLQKALITGVMRISKESLFSGLNNIKVFDMFDDELYTNDYGFTESEVAELCDMAGLDTPTRATLKAWYNGIMVNGTPIYNTYSTVSFLDSGKFQCHWTRSGVMDTIADLLTEERMETLTRLLDGEQIEEPVERRVSVLGLMQKPQNSDFYSLLVQAGYLAMQKNPEHSETAYIDDFMLLSVPNKELAIAWQQFILKHAFTEPAAVLNIFRNHKNPKKFAEDLEKIFDDRMSVYDFEKPQDREKQKILERTYQQLMLVLLCAYGDSEKHPISNRESGDGRYDILVERREAYYIFELKSCDKAEQLENAAQQALQQINSKRYGAELDSEKLLIKIGMAFYGKQCRVVCE